jgi:glycine/D-amino acid oxidase-like deaminating enzyme
MADKKQHVIIIGAGVIGACSTYFLSQHKHCSITLIEQTDIACAASGKSGGFLALDWNDDHPGMKSLSRASFALHQQLNQELDGENTYGYRAVNTYSVIFDTHLENTKDKSPIDWICQDKLRSFEQIGSTETTAQLMPHLFTKTLVERAQQTGRIKVKIGKGVSRLLYQKEAVIGVELEDGEQMLADKVVVCMGPWSGLLEMPTKQDRIPITASHVHSIVLRPNKDIVIPNQALFTAILENGKTAEPEVRIYE